MDRDYKDLKIERIFTNQLGVEVGVIGLNRPQALNALNSHMINGIVDQLKRWATDASIEMVIIRGLGDRAYCAGGDIKALYEAGNVQFLAGEYRLDHALYNYPKPILHLMHGIVMGGGMGLMSSGSLRLCSTNTEFAMPETAIGFFPDVGMRYHLARLPKGLGAFIALTGARFTPKLARLTGVVDGVLPESDRQVMKSHVYERIAEWRRKEGPIIHWIQEWVDENEDSIEGLAEVIDEPVEDFISKDIIDWCDFYWNIPNTPWWPDLAKLVASPSPCPDLIEWPENALESLSPLSLATTNILMRRAEHQELSQVFDEDYWAAAKLYADGDLKEGVLAKVIEKRSPKWKYSPEEITDEILSSVTPPETIASVLRKAIDWKE